jgi:hypothetical protein
MFSKLFDLLFGYFKNQPFWSRVEPVLTLIALYAATLSIAYKYIEWEYHFSPEIHLFARSYVVKQISVVFLAIALLALVFAAGAPSEPGRWSRMGQWLRAGAKKMVVAGVVLALVFALLLHLNPNKVSHITLKFLDEPRKFDKYALTYIVYELNRSQVNWHFEINFDTFNPDDVSSSQRSECASDPLCYAKIVAADKPFVGVTEKELGVDSFWQNASNVSVITVNEWEREASPSVYEYLTYSLIVQSTLIHLNQNCGGLPPGSLRPGRGAYGNLFEFVPRRNAVKAAILAAHLTPEGEELLANCFGLEYMSTCNRLLTLDWLRSDRVRNNLEKSFKEKL